MSTIKFITFTDVHISTVNPVFRTGSYLDDIINKLQQVKDVGKKLGVKFFILAGDLFNLKAPMRNPHLLNAQLIDLFNSFPAPVYAIEGNHDLRKDSYETFDEQPLNVIYASGALKKLDFIRHTIDDKKIDIRGYRFKEEPDLDTLEKAKSDADLSIGILHLYSSMDGGALFHRKIYSYSELGGLGHDIYVLGHYHIDQGIQKLKQDGKEKTFVNVGALSRGSLDSDNINRSPKIGLVSIDIEKNNISVNGQAIRLKVRPAEEAFDVDRKEKEKIKLRDAEEFVEKIKMEMDATSDKRDDILNEAKNLDIEKAVLDKVSYYLDEATLVKNEIEV